MENNFIQWSIDPEIFSLGPLSIRWYGLLFALGFVVGYYIMEWIFKIENKPKKDLENLTMYMAISTIIGARLGHVFFYDWGYYSQHLEQIFMVWRGGLASHGAAIGIAVGLWLFVRKRQKDFTYMWILDRIAITIALAGCFIRLGNLMNSEILGLASNSSFAFVFTKLKIEEQFPRHPVQLYEAISYLIFFFVLFAMYLKKKATIPSGRLFGLFLMLIFGIRFVIEFFKEGQVDASHFINSLPINMGQLLSIPAVLIGSYIFARSFNTQKKL